MDGREVRNGAQVAPNATGEMNREVRAGGVEPANAGWNSVGRGFEDEAGVSGENFDNGREGELGRAQEQRYSAERGAAEQRYDAERARGIGGLAMGQTMVGAPEVGQVLTYNPEAVNHARSEMGAAEFGVVQGRNASEMMGVAGENLRQLEHLPERVRMQNERVREQAELENGYARNEIDPNLSSVGLASNLEAAEREKTDMANAKGEFAPVTSDDKRQNTTQEGIGKAMAAEVGNYQKQKSFVANDIVKLRDKGMLEILAAFKNPRIFKERN